MTEDTRLDDLAPVIERETPPAPAPAPAPEDTSRIVTLSQNKLDKLLTSAMGRSAATTRAELATANQTITDLQAQLKAANPDSTVADRLNAELLVARAEITSIKQASVQQSTASHLEQLAAAANFVDPVLTRTILSAQVVRNDNGSYSVVDTAGNVRLNEHLEPMTVEELVTETANAKPFLVRGTVKSGSGSTPSTSYPHFRDEGDLQRLFGKNSSAYANAYALKNPLDYAAKKILAKQAGII